MYFCMYVCMYINIQTYLYIPYPTRPDQTKPDLHVQKIIPPYLFASSLQSLCWELNDYLPIYIHIEVDVYYIHMSMCKYLINTVYSVYSTGRDRNP